ncbi:hypothetical protein C3727_05665, partial [Escherichia coli]
HPFLGVFLIFLGFKFLSIKITASFSPCPVVHIPLDKNALSEKMSKIFSGDRNFCCRTHLCFRS